MEDFAVEKLVAEPGIERLDEAVFPWAAGRDIGGLGADRADPALHGVGDEPWPSVSSFGTRPTVDGIEPLLEAHLFDFDGDLYGKRIEVEFVAKLRDEERFPDLASLVKQMRIDATRARGILQQRTRLRASA